MATPAFTNHDNVNGMYRLKLAWSNKTPFLNKVLGNKNLIRKYRQRRGQKRYRSKEDQNQFSAEYDTVEEEIKPTLPVVSHHTTRNTEEW